PGIYLAAVARWHQFASRRAGPRHAEHGRTDSAARTAPDIAEQARRGDISRRAEFPRPVHPPGARAVVHRLLRGGTGSTAATVGGIFEEGVRDPGSGIREEKNSGPIAGALGAAHRLWAGA